MQARWTLVRLEERQDTADRVQQRAGAVGEGAYRLQRRRHARKDHSHVHQSHHRLRANRRVFTARRDAACPG